MCAKPQVTIASPCTAVVAVLLKLLVYVHHPRLCDLLPSTLSTVIVPILSHSLEWFTIDHLSVLDNTSTVTVHVVVQQKYLVYKSEPK